MKDRIYYLLWYFTLMDIKEGENPYIAYEQFLKTHRLADTSKFIISHQNWTDIIPLSSSLLARAQQM